MNIFIRNSFVFVILLSVTVYVLLIQSDGSSDSFYKRFTSSKQSSFIIGSSRSAQGILPGVLNKILNRTDIYNYSFSIGHSPFGPVYYKSIKNKLKAGTKDGIFIISIDPWNISSMCKDPDDTLSFRESNLLLANIHSVNQNPNYDYLLNYWNGPYYRMFPAQSAMTLHDDGWLEISVKMDSLTVQKRIKSMINTYRDDKSRIFNLSNIRVKYLIDIISYLKRHGTVYLLQLPVHPKMAEIENIYMPNFDKIIQRVLDSCKVSYYDMSYLNSKYQYTDGNHLFKESGEKVSEKIAAWIISENTK